MQFVYKLDGSLPMLDQPSHVLGGKGAGLATMLKIGLPVPPAFTITTAVCDHYYANNKRHPDGLRDDVNDALLWVEKHAGRKFGDENNPLLVSVRSGARASMPGMMDTVLNLGLNDATVNGLAAATGDERFAYDSYRRFIQMYSDVVIGIDHAHFERALSDLKRARGVQDDTELSGGDLRELVGTFKAISEKESGVPFPQDVHVQLWGAIDAVFSSWMTDRAVFYRRLNAIPESWGTAVNVQAMVFGNLGNTSATGVAFTRDPSTGARALYGEFLVNAQGEDVVAGIRTPHSISEAGRMATESTLPSMEALMPDAYADLVRATVRLEHHYRDMQDIEFTIERGKLWILQTRAGKRSAAAAVKIAISLVDEGTISREEAVSRVPAAALDQLLHPRLSDDATFEVIARGLPASPGAACGRIVFTAAEAEAESAKGHDVILVRQETSPEDIHGMHAAKGILTVRGGMTSHAAVVARGMGKPCVCGAEALTIDPVKGVMIAGKHRLQAGSELTIDGSNGSIIAGSVPMQTPELSGEFARLMEWADEFRRLAVRANAETPEDALAALRFGAEGIGLVRTEHMFFEPARVHAVREMILADDESGRRAALAKLLPMQREDLIELFQIMGDLPVTIRLLDPPLHEFLPKDDKEIRTVASACNVSVEHLRDRIASLSESNPMLGFRGCRLAVAFPEIAIMQAKAIFEAVADVFNDSGIRPVPEIMVPLVLGSTDFNYVKNLIDATARDIAAERRMTFDYLVGTMIELPRAALRSGEIAEFAEFFSFGTNDLTQTSLGISRDDASTFLDYYLKKGLLDRDPFVGLDESGVGELIHISIERARATRPNIKLGICGEHAADPHTVAFCHRAGLDYVSCSPFRVPVARLAAAQAALQDRGSAGELWRGAAATETPSVSRASG